MLKQIRGCRSRFLVPLIVAGGFVVVTFVVVNVANDLETGGTAGGFTGTTCSTKCVWFTQKRCENNSVIGGCFGFWGCNDGIGDILVKR